MNLCRPCGQDFASLAAFDEHRTGRHDYILSEGLAQDPPVEDGRRCFSVSELEEFGWTKDEKGRWRYPDDWSPQAWIWDAADADVERIVA